MSRVAIITVVLLVCADARVPYAQALVTEPDVLARAVIFVDRQLAGGEVRKGWYVDFANMIPGAGWLSGGPGYRQWFAKDRLFADASAALSSGGYKTAQGRIEFPRLARSRLLLGSQVRWQDFTHIDTFAPGPDSSSATRHEYAVRSHNVAGYAIVRPRQWLGVGATVGWLQLRDQPSFLHDELSVTADTRDFPNHPTRGVFARAAAAHFADRDAGMFSFRQYQAEGAGFVPALGNRLVIVSHAWLVASATDRGQAIPFYLQPSLGGRNTLRSYTDYRFHDRNLLVLNVEGRVPLMTHVEAAGFVDAGNVASRLADLNLGKKSIGGGLRVHSARQTFLRLDAAHGAEGWRLTLWISDALNLARASRRTVSVPFVP